MDTNLVLEIVQTFLTTSFEGGRHLRRVEKITQLEKQECFPHED
jgi:ribose 5-phosphate isomerase RpiB